MSTARWLLALSAVLIFAIFAAQSVSAQGTLTGDIPPDGGVVPVEWSGGSIDALRAAAEDAGCDLSAVLLDVGGTSLTYVVGAPGFVNAEWWAATGPEIEATPLVIVCDTPGLESGHEMCLPNGGGVYDYVVPGPDVENPWVFADSPWEALDEQIQFLAGFPNNGGLPDGTLVEADVSDSRVTWELLARHGGAVVGRFNVVGDRYGWRLSSAVWCVYPTQSDDPVVDRPDDCELGGPMTALTILDGTLPASGFAFVRADGALSIADLGRALKALDIRVASLFLDGQEVFFICHAPSAVNKHFLALFPDGFPAGQILTVRIED